MRPWIKAIAIASSVHASIYAMRWRHLTIELASTVHDMASNGFAPKVRSEAVDRSSLGPLSGELKQVTKRPVMADSGRRMQRIVSESADNRARATRRWR